MKRIYLILTMMGMIAIISSHAQTKFKKVDRKEIEKKITNSKSEDYYSKLLKRFLSFDTTLTLEHYRLIYYGFVFQNEYTGYNEDKSKEIRSYIKQQKYKEAIKLADSVLEKLPISLTVNYLKALALYKVNEKDPFMPKFRDRYYWLVDAILSSGDGIDCETAFKTIFVSDEYEIIYGEFEIQEIKEQRLQNPCDVFSIKSSSKFNHDLIYFDTSESLAAMEKVFNKK